MADDPNTHRSNRFGLALESFLHALLRLLIVLAIGAVVVGLVYFGTVVFYKQSVLPARENATRMDRLETVQAISQEQQSEQLHQFEIRLSALESLRSLDGETLAGLSTNDQAMQAALDQQSQALDELSQMESELTRLDSIGSYNATQSAEIARTLQAGNLSIPRLQRDLQLIRSMQYLDQARILLARSNYGEAEMSVFNGRKALETALEQTGESQQSLVMGWINRLDVIRSELPAYPFLAAQDLEIVWSAMAEGFPPQPETASMFSEDVTPTATPYFTPTPFDTPTPALTTPLGTPTPDSTPTPFNTPTKASAG